jgi:hypothetical protein
MGHAIGRTILHVSFGIVKNARTTQIGFDVMGMHYIYNDLFGRGSINAFDAIITHPYLYINMSTASKVITVFGDQIEARNIEKDSPLGKRIVHILTILDEDSQIESKNVKLSLKSKSSEQIKKEPLNSLVSDKTIIIRTPLLDQEEKTLFHSSKVTRYLCLVIKRPRRN